MFQKETVTSSSLPEPATIDYTSPPVERKSMVEVANQLRAAGHYDITHGFPAANAQELFDLLYELLMDIQGHAQPLFRMPIIGVRNNEQGVSIFMLTNPDPQQKRDHATLMSRLGEPQNVAFTTSIEQMTMVVPDLKKAISLTVAPQTTDGSQTLPEREFFFVIGNGSDLSQLPVFTHEGEDLMRPLFTAAGAKTIGF